MSSSREGLLVRRNDSHSPVYVQSEKLSPRRFYLFTYLFDVDVHCFILFDDRGVCVGSHYIDERSWTIVKDGLLLREGEEDVRSQWISPLRGVRYD